MSAHQDDLVNVLSNSYQPVGYAQPLYWSTRTGEGRENWRSGQRARESTRLRRLGVEAVW